MKFYYKLGLLTLIGAFGTFLFGVRVTGFAACESAACGSVGFLPAIGLFIFVSALGVFYLETRQENERHREFRLSDE